MTTRRGSTRAGDPAVVTSMDSRTMRCPHFHFPHDFLNRRSPAHASATVVELVDLAWVGTLDLIGHGATARPW
ncbi:MAG TPA: hypothetical protein VIM30_09745 [Candidatus Limnocylindrales bacterium]